MSSYRFVEPFYEYDVHGLLNIGRVVREQSSSEISCSGGDMLILSPENIKAPPLKGIAGRWAFVTNPQVVIPQSMLHLLSSSSEQPSTRMMFLLNVEYLG